MKKNKVVLNLQGLSVPDKVQKAKNIVTALTGNTNFATPMPTLRDITTAISSLENAYSQAQETRDVAATKTAVKNQQEEALNLLLTALGGYVEGESKGDEAKIKSAAMDIKTKATAVGVPVRITNLMLTEGEKAASLDAKWKPVRGARSYLIAITETVEDAPSWKQATVVTKAAAIISGLVSGKKYWLRVCAVGAAGTGEWSDPAVKIAS